MSFSWNPRRGFPLASNTTCYDGHATMSTMSRICDIVWKIRNSFQVVGPSGGELHLSGTLREAAELQDQIDNHGKIDQQRQTFADARGLGEFVDFLREQGSRLDKRKLLSTALGLSP